MTIILLNKTHIQKNGPEAVNSRPAGLLYGVGGTGFEPVTPCL